MIRFTSIQQHPPRETSESPCDGCGTPFGEPHGVVCPEMQKLEEETEGTANDSELIRAGSEATNE